jgi:hypothetical protein
MIEILGHSITNLPIKNLRKINDLIEYEGPILSHFVDEKGRNFLFYWVDVSSEYNRWLVWKISDLQLYNYLFGVLSLRELLLEQNKDFIYVVDIDSNLKYENIKMLLVEDLSLEYLPEEESFLSSNKIKEYQDLIKKFQPSEYLSYLRKNSIYFTLEPITLDFSSTISAIDASNFLKKVSNSFLGFIEYDFFNSFKDSISDGSKLFKLIKQFKEILAPRVVDLQFSSFKVALSADTIQSVDSSIYKSWQSGILEKYKDEVIEVDLNSESVLRSIAERYSIEARKSIYSPIVEIINDKNYKLKISDQKRKVIKRFNPINKKQEEILIPKEQVLEEKKGNKILLSLIVEVSDKEDIKQIGKRELQSGLLFTQEVKEFPIRFETMETASLKIFFRKSIECDIRLEGNIYYLSITDFPVKSEAKIIEDGKKLIQHKFIEFYLDFLENPQNFEKGLVEKLNSVVEKFIKL